MKKINNKGMSLVEIIVVLSIMVILTGAITISLNAALTKPADECAQKMLNAMNACRVSTMGKNETSILFHINDGTVYVSEYIDGRLVRDLPISGKGVNVVYKYKNGIETDLSSTPLSIGYDRSTGGFVPCTPTGDYCSQIVVSKGDRTITLILYNITGKVSIEK